MSVPHNTIRGAAAHDGSKLARATSGAVTSITHRHGSGKIGASRGGALRQIQPPGVAGAAIAP
jgi:hypothetical protein